MEEKQQGLYYRVKNKLDKLIKVMDYPDITNILDNEVLHRLLMKFEVKNKISAEDMKICNEMWKRYGNNK